MDKQAIYTLAFFQDQLIGSSDINKLDKRRSHIGQFGISLSKEFRSDGIGTKLAEYTINLAKKNLNISLIKLSVYKPNMAALKLYQKLGFIEYGTLPEGIQYKEKLIDEIMMYLTFS